MPKRVHATPFIIHPPDDLLAARPDLGRMASDLARAYRRMGDAFEAAARHGESRDRDRDRPDKPDGITVIGDDGLRAAGGALWDALVAADPTLPARLAAERAAAGSYLLPVAIESGVPAVQLLPWETLHHPEYGFLGRDGGFTLSRRFPGPAAKHPPDPGPLRAVMFTCLPDDVDPERGRLEVEEQQARALAAFGDAVSRGLVALRMPDDGRFSTFEAILREFDPHLVFLFAHGKFIDTPGRTGPPYAVIQFEDDHGGSDFVREDRLAEAFRGTGARAVVLAACESGMGNSQALAAGLAGAISRAGIPHVLGMRESVLARAGIAFNAAFAAAVVGGERADVAAQLARAAITRPLAGIAGLDEAAAELSLGQWPLPALISPRPDAPLVDWNFTPRPPARVLTSDNIGGIPLPPRFLGRRRELREWQEPLLRGERPVLLISGVGGRGKTALAGKIARAWLAEGRPAVAWSARDGLAGWDAFYLGLVRRAGEQAFVQATAGLDDETARAAALLRLLLRRGGDLLVFLDNLETAQDPRDLTWTDGRPAAFIAAARALAEEGTGLRLLLTTRARPPGWPAAAELPLRRVTFGDYLQLALAGGAPAAFWQPGRPRLIYDTLDGNARGLEFAAGALEGLDPAAGEAFLEGLRKAEAKVRVNIALATLVGNLDSGPRALLARLPAYDTAVPLDGIRALALDRPDLAAALDRLLAVGLAERYEDHERQATVYQAAPAAAAWLADQPGYALEPAWLRAAADYQGWLFAHERPTLEQAMVLHRALARAGQQDAADRLALRHIIRPLDRAGLYRTLLDHWLPALRESADGQTRSAGLDWTAGCLKVLGDLDAALPYYEESLEIDRRIGDRAGEGATLNNLSQIYDARGDYDTALTYLEQSLAIRRAIGDRAGEGATLNNISQIYKARGDYDTALTYLEQSLAIQRAIGDASGMCASLINIGHIYWQNEQQGEALGAWVAAYQIASRIGYAQALAALEGLAGQLGLPGGLAGWAALAGRMGGTTGGE